MSEFEPIELDEDARHLINGLTEIGLLSGKLVSRAAREFGDYHPITKAFDNVAQRITATLLEFQIARKELEDNG